MNQDEINATPLSSTPPSGEGSESNGADAPVEDATSEETKIPADESEPEVTNEMLLDAVIDGRTTAAYRFSGLFSLLDLLPDVIAEAIRRDDKELRDKVFDLGRKLDGMPSEGVMREAIYQDGKHTRNFIQVEGRSVTTAITKDGELTRAHLSGTDRVMTERHNALMAAINRRHDWDNPFWALAALVLVIAAFALGSAFGPHQTHTVTKTVTRTVQVAPPKVVADDATKTQQLKDAHTTINGLKAKLANFATETYAWNASFEAAYCGVKNSNPKLAKQLFELRRSLVYGQGHVFAALKPYGLQSESQAQACK